MKNEESLDALDEKLNGTKPKRISTSSAELQAMSKCDKILLSLEDEARQRVLAWVLAVHGRSDAKTS